MKTLGTGKANATSMVATMMPSRLVNRMKNVRMTWIRTRLRDWLSVSLPSSQDP